MRPGRLLALSFASTALAGAGLLSLPGAVVGQRLGFTDALFTATSAVCVTGLTVADTGTRFTIFGQTVIAALIQVGGLGIMTLSTILLLSIGQRLSFRDHTLIRNTLSRSRDRSLPEFIQYVVRVTIAIEFVGAVVLSSLLILRHGYGWQAGMGYGTFLAVSAFCNAGFTLWADSLASFRGDGLLVGTVMILIVLGGLGFVVLVNLRTRLIGDELGERQGLALHSRIVLATTATLLLASFALFVLVEWNGALNQLSPGDRLWCCAFQSVTSRTAGFSVVPETGWTMTSITLMMLLMGIGAAPGSTGGGLKVTTLAVLWANARARFRGQQTVPLFNRSVPDATVRRSLTAAAVGFVATIAIVFVLFLVEQAKGPASAADFLPRLFEVVSALGTVGLSLGVTHELTIAGRWVVILAMFVGRLGPLTLALAVARKPRELHVRLTEEDVMVG